TKNNGICGASFCASDIDISIRHLTFLAFCGQLTGLYSLNTKATLLHYTSRPHGHIRIKDHFAQVTVLRGVDTCKILVIVVFEPVKPSDLIRTVVRTIPCSDTSVIGHLVKAFRTVGSSNYRTNRFTRRIVTMLAGHRLESDLRVICGNLQFLIGFCSLWRAIITVNPDPRHFTSVEHFLLTHHRYVIFNLTGHRTSTTANTGVHVNGHSPMVLAVFMTTPKRNFRRLYKFTFVVDLRMISSSRRILLVLGQSGFLNHVLPAHVCLVGLGLRDMVFITGDLYGYSLSDVKICKSVGIIQKFIGIDPYSIRYPSGLAPSIS